MGKVIETKETHLSNLKTTNKANIRITWGHENTPRKKKNNKRRKLIIIQMKKKLLQTNMIQIIFQIHHDVLVENNHIQQS